MLQRAANWLQRGIFPVSSVANDIGLAVIALMASVTVADVVSRRVFNAPITGALEISSLGLVIVIFLGLAYCAANDGHIVLDILVVKFTERAQAIISTVMYLLTIGMMSMASWQLWVYGTNVKSAGQISGVLGLPIYPFLYLAALGGVLFTLVYVTYLLRSLDKARK